MTGLNRAIGQSSRTPYTLGSQIARGGEGTVFELQGHPDRVAKIYMQPVDGVRLEKLNALIRLNRPQLMTVSAWPQEVLLDQQKKPVGFIMPAVRGGRPLHMFVSPYDRQKHAPNAGYRTLISVASNLARAVMTFHQAGVIIADINFSNFLVLSDGTVRVIDCDSVQIGNKPKFRSAVAMVEFVPPELQGKRVADYARTHDHDNFGLSVLIFLLLVQGRHPFSGSGAVPLGDAIKDRLHPFSHGRGRTCPFCVLDIKDADILSAELIELFKVSFNGGRQTWRLRRRPSPRRSRS